MVFAHGPVLGEQLVQKRVKYAFDMIERASEIKDEERRSKREDWLHHQIFAATMLGGSNQKYVMSAVYDPLMKALKRGDLRPNVVNGLRKVVENVLTDEVEVSEFEEAVEAIQSSGVLIADTINKWGPQTKAGVPSWRKKLVSERAALESKKALAKGAGRKREQK